MQAIDEGRLLQEVRQIVEQEGLGGLACRVHRDVPQQHDTRIRCRQLVAPRVPP